MKKDLEKDKEQSWEDALLFDTKKEKLRQLWLYQYLMLKHLTSEAGLKLGGEILDINNYKVIAKIYSFRNLKENLEVSQLLDSEGVTDFILQSENYLKTIAEELLNPEIPFEQTDDLEICQYCDFRGICGR